MVGHSKGSAEAIADAVANNKNAITLASGNERITLLKVDDTKEIYYSLGNANYYMGDLDDPGEYEHYFPDALIIERDDIEPILE